MGAAMLEKSNDALPILREKIISGEKGFTFIQGRMQIECAHDYIGYILQPNMAFVFHWLYV